MPGEGQDAVELLLVPTPSPPLVVEVLLPPGRVGAHGLQVTVGERADPHVPPGRWDGQRPDPLKHLGVGDPPPVGIEVLEPAPAPPSPDAGLVRVDAPQSGHGLLVPGTG